MSLVKIEFSESLILPQILFYTYMLHEFDKNNVSFGTFEVKYRLFIHILLYYILLANLK